MKIFFPIRFIDVPSGPPHGEGTFYRVSYGTEHWDDKLATVYKVQMVYDGIVHGRRSPSFPDKGNDWELVGEAMKALRSGKGQSGRGRMEVASPIEGIRARTKKSKA